MSFCECGFMCAAKNMSRHKSRCNIRKMSVMEKQLLQHLQDKIEESKRMTDSKLDEKDRLIAEKDRLIAEKDKLIANKEAEINRLLTEHLAESRMQGRPTTINNFNHINIVAFGDEPIPNTTEVLKILYPPEDSVTKYIELKHFRDPSTSNVRIRNKRSKTIQVLQHDVNRRLRWTERDRKQTIERIVDDNMVELTEKHGASNVARWRRWYHSNMLEAPGYDKTDAYKRILQDVEYMLVTQMNTAGHA